MTNDLALIVFVAGFAGAIVKDIIQDNALQLPEIKDGKILMGFIGGGIIGGFAGLSVDHSYLTAFLAGFMGASVIYNLLPKPLGETQAKDNFDSQ